MNTDPIFTAVDELREVAGDAPATRKVVDKLFRHVHTLKANASANGLSELAAAAHEFENVLHSMRTGAIAEGARLFLVHANFDVADFDQKFQSLKETLSNTGEVISTSPGMSHDHPEKLNFKILYAETSDAVQTLSNIPGLIVEETTPTASATTRGAHFDGAFEKLSEEIRKLTATPAGSVFEQTVRAGRSAALALGKNVDFEVRGQDLELDKALVETLIHLVRNAVDHGIESSEERLKLGKAARGKIVIEATGRDDQITITVTDDGRGIHPALIEKIFHPGFSTASETSEISGRGVGLDAVKTAIEEPGGSITVRSDPGHGSTFEITLPKKIRVHPR